MFHNSVDALMVFLHLLLDFFMWLNSVVGLSRLEGSRRPHSHF